MQINLKKNNILLIKLHVKSHLKEKYNEFETDVINFYWLLINGYEDKKGTARAQQVKVYKPPVITYLLKHFPPNSEIIIYIGYLEGAIDFSVFE